LLSYVDALAILELKTPSSVELSRQPMKKEIRRAAPPPPLAPRQILLARLVSRLRFAQREIYSRSEIYVYLSFARARACLLCNPLSRNFANLRELRLIFVRLMYYIRDDGQTERARESERGGGGGGGGGRGGFPFSSVRGEFANGVFRREELA